MYKYMTFSKGAIYLKGFEVEGVYKIFESYADYFDKYPERYVE